MKELWSAATAAADEWVDVDGAINRSSLGAFVKRRGQSQPLVRSLQRVLEFYTTPSTDTLLKRHADESIGIMLTQFAARPTSYFDPTPKRYGDIIIPAGIVQCDVAGSVEVCLFYVQLIAHILL